MDWEGAGRGAKWVYCLRISQENIEGVVFTIREALGPPRCD